MLSITPVALAKTRQSHLIDFIYDHQKGNESFGASSQDTANAIEILDYYDAYVVEVLFEETKSVDKADLKVYLGDTIQAMFDTGYIEIYSVYNLLEALDTIESLVDSLDSDLHNEIYSYINETVQIGGGFSLTNSSNNANMVSTYYTYKILTIMGEPVDNQTLHKSWVLSCNNTDGGYGGNQTLSSTLITTYYAAYLINELGTINDLANQTATLNYFKSLYIGDSNNLEHYGGYLPNLYAEIPLLSSTFFCVEGIDLINDNELNKDATSKWVLKNQNYLDGGFSDWVEGTEESTSSISSSYYAFKILRNFGLLDLLNEEIFMVEPSFLTLIIVPSVIGVIILVIYLLWRRRRI